MVRLFFTKRDRAKYISHLDITRCFARALARTTLPVWYTEGFNPRIYMSFPLPIPLGYQSSCESMEVKLNEDDFPLEEVTAQLNAVLPEGIRILRTALPVEKPDAIALADYCICMATPQPEVLQAAFTAFAAQESIAVVKKTKKGEKQLDLRPLFTVGGVESSEGAVTLRLRLAAGITLNISPALLLEAFSDYLGYPVEDVAVERLAILTADGAVWH
ncbi:MAG: TIGR03936 family radical SAM-associated protein [Angelakisella sp.]